MADMTVGRGSTPSEPFKGGPNMSKMCQESVEHTKGVAERTVLTQYRGVTLNITEGAPGADKIHGLFFG